MMGGPQELEHICSSCITSQDTKVVMGGLSRLRSLTSAAAGEGQVLEYLQALASSGIPDAVAESRLLHDPLLASCSCGLLRSWYTAASTLPCHAQALTDQFQGGLFKAASNLLALVTADVAGSDAVSDHNLACLLQGMSCLIGLPISLQADKAPCTRQQQQHPSRSISRAGSPAGRINEDSRAGSSTHSTAHRNGSQGNTRIKSQGRTARRFSTRTAGRSTSIWDAHALQPDALQAVCSAGLWQVALARIHTMIERSTPGQQDSSTCTYTSAQFLSCVCEMLAGVAQVHYDQQPQVQSQMQTTYHTLASTVCAALARLAQDAGLQPAPAHGHSSPVAPDTNNNSHSSLTSPMPAASSYQWLCAWAADLAVVLTALHKLMIEDNRFGCIATPLTARAVNTSGCWTLISQLVDAMASSNLPSRGSHAPGQQQNLTTHGVACDGDATTATHVLAVQAVLSVALEPLAKLCHDLPSACSSCPEGSDLHQGLQQSVEQLADALLPRVLDPGLSAGTHRQQTGTSLHTWVEMLTDLVTACSEDWLKAMVLKCCKQVRQLAPSLNSVQQQQGGTSTAQHSTNVTPATPFAPQPPAGSAHRSQAPEAAAAGVGMALFCLWTLECKGTLDYLLESHDYVQQLLKSATQPPDQNVPRRSGAGPLCDSGLDAGWDASPARTLQDAYGSVSRTQNAGIAALMAGMRRLEKRRLPTVISDVPMQEDDGEDDDHSEPAPGSGNRESSNSPGSVSGSGEDALSHSTLMSARGCLHTAIQVLSLYSQGRQADVCSVMRRDLACASAAMSAECLWELSGGPPEKGMVAGLAISRHASIIPGTESWSKHKSKATLGAGSVLSRQDSQVMIHRTSLLRHLNSSRRSLGNSTSSAHLDPLSFTHLSRPNSTRKNSTALSGSFIGPSSILKHVRSDAAMGTSAPGRQVSFMLHGSKSSLARQGASGLLEDSFLLRLGGEEDADGPEGSSRSLLTRAPGMRLETNTSLRSVKEAGDGEEEQLVPLPALQLAPVGPPSSFFVNKQAARRKSACDLPPPRRASYVDFDAGEVSGGLSRSLLASASTQQLVTSPKTDAHILEYLGSMLPLLGSWAPNIDTTLKLCDYISLVAVELGLLQQQASSRDSRSHSSYHSSHMQRLEQLLLAAGQVIAHMLETASSLDLHQRITSHQVHLSKPHEKRFSCLYQSAGRALAVMQVITGVEPDCTSSDVVHPALSSQAASGALKQLLHLSCQDVLLEDAAFQAHAGLMGWASQALLYLPGASKAQVVADCPTFISAASQVYSKSWRGSRGHVLGRVLLELQADDPQIRTTLRQEGLAAALCAQLTRLYQPSRGNSSLWPSQSTGLQSAHQLLVGTVLPGSQEGLLGQSATAPSSFVNGMAEGVISTHKALLPLCLAFSLTEQATVSQDMAGVAALVAAGVLPPCLDSVAQQLTRSESSRSMAAALCDITSSGVAAAEEHGFRVSMESSTWVPLPHLITLVAHVVQYINSAAVVSPTDPQAFLLSAAAQAQAFNRLGDGLQALLQALQASEVSACSVCTVGDEADPAARAAGRRVQALADKLLADLAVTKL